jgi:hypothetical protein
MAAIVKANPSLANGGLAVLRRSYSTTDDGTLTYEADYCCLAQFANNHLGKFRTGAQPPTPIPTSLSTLRLDAAPKLFEFNTKTQSGLTYFFPRYTAASRDAGEVITTETQEQRSFSSTLVGQITTAGNLDSRITVRGLVNVTFDYISTTRQVNAKNPGGLPNVRGAVGQPFNYNVGRINNQIARVSSEQIVSETIETQSTTRSSRGAYTYTKSSSGIYAARPAAL